MKILYLQTNGEIAIIMPCDCGMTIEQIALKDVPHNAPFLIVEDTDLPTNWETSAAWECDFSAPHGIGMGAQRYLIAQAEANTVEILARAAPTPEPDVVVTPMSSIIWDGEPTDEEKAEWYANYLAQAAQQNTDIVASHEKALLAFQGQQSRDQAQQEALIAQMKAEVLQLEGVAL